MSLKSMTGYGYGKASSTGMDWEVEVSSVNRKQLDVRVNIPKELAVLDSKIVEIISKNISRGSVSVVVRARNDQIAKNKVNIDKTLAKEYLSQLKKIAKELKVENDVNLSTLIKMPGVMAPIDLSTNKERSWRIIRKALLIAIKQHDETRSKEGAKLCKDIESRLKIFADRLERIKLHAPQVAKRYRKSLKKRIESAGIKIKDTEPSLLREIAIFADKADITEEITRLDGHISQANAILKASQPSGRLFDFLCQEMLREINTIGSKANDYKVTTLVIELKAILESIREQVQNIE